MGSVLLTEFCYLEPTSKSTLLAQEVICLWNAIGRSLSPFRQIMLPKLFANGLPPVDSTFCPKKALLAGQNVEIMYFVRSERNPPDKQCWGIMAGENLTKGFQSHVESVPMESWPGWKTQWQKYRLFMGMSLPCASDRFWREGVP